MASFELIAIAALKKAHQSSVARRKPSLLVAAASVIGLAGWLAPSAASAAECKFGPVTPLAVLGQAEPPLIIDGDCTDPDYNERTFVITKTEQLAFQVPGGPLIPYTQVTGHFPVMATLATLPAGVLVSPKTDQQNYVWRFPAKEFWQHRSLQVQHPLGGGAVDSRLAFTTGAFAIGWTPGNAVATHRVHAAATKLAKAYARALYGDTAPIYSYFWGCSGGGTVSMAATENTTGVWAGVLPSCLAPNGGSHHSFQLQGIYQLAIPEAKRGAIAAAAAPGSGLDIYAGLDPIEKGALVELLSSGFPIASLRPSFKLAPLINPGQIRATDPTYEDDFWSKPGYAGANQPAYLAAAKVDGFATITGVTRNAQNLPTAIQLDPATVPRLGSIGDTNLQFYVFAADGTTRIIDPTQAGDAATIGSIQTNARFSLSGTLDPATGTVTLAGTNSPVLLGALAVGGKIRINNRFPLAVHFYARHTIRPSAMYDLYRNADGSPKYPQRTADFVGTSQYNTMGGRVESGDIKTKTVIFGNMGDANSYPLYNAGYALLVRRALGPAKANDMMRVYIQDNGQHSTGGLVAGVFNQALIDLMAWAEKGVTPKPSTEFTILNGQVILPPRAADRHGLQPVINLTVNGGDRAVVGVNQPVNLAARLEMPPKTGQIVQYSWTVSGTTDPATVIAKPQPLVDVKRTITFPAPGTYVIRLNVNGQRDGLVDPANQTLARNFKDVRVVVQ